MDLENEKSSSYKKPLEKSPSVMQEEKG